MPATDRWLSVGLGNTEPEYAGTRHNVGAELVRLLARRAGAELATNKRVGCRVAETRQHGERLVLAWPIGYVNGSGDPVQRAVAWYQVPPERLVVVHDELDLDVGRLRIKRGGGSAGHNGLRDIDRRLGTHDYLRIRIGIGRPPGRRDPKDHVLRRFTAGEREVIDVLLEHAADAVGHLMRDGLEPTQNRYHSLDLAGSP